MKDVILRFFKKLDYKGRLLIPAPIKNHFKTDEYYVELHDDCIKLIPVKKERS